MNVLATIAARAAEHGLSFVIAGGHAVIVHGFPRNTFDLDLVIRRDQVERWTDLIQGLGYVFIKPTFLQFNPPQNPSSLPLDLMLVNQQIFEKLLAEALTAPESALNAKVVSLRHLLSLKCHAIKHGHPGRIVKDVDDVIRLVQANNIDLNDPNIRDLFLKHGTKTCMKKSKESAEQTEAVPLEFPDWSGMDDAEPRLDAEAAFHLCEQYGAWFPELKSRWRAQQPPKCTEEFVL